MERDEVFVAERCQRWLSDGDEEFSEFLERLRRESTQKLELPESCFCRNYSIRELRGGKPLWASITDCSAREFLSDSLQCSFHSLECKWKGCDGNEKRAPSKQRQLEEIILFKKLSRYEYWECKKSLSAFAKLRVMRNVSRRDGI